MIKAVKAQSLFIGLTLAFGLFCPLSYAAQGQQPSSLAAALSAQAQGKREFDAKSRAAVRAKLSRDEKIKLDKQLIDAANSGDSAQVIALLRCGANPDFQEEHGNTALILAAFNGHSLVVEALIKAGATRDLQNNDGRTALMFAAFSGHRAVVTTLLRAGAFVDLRDKDGRTALMVAALNGHGNIIRILLRFGADVTLKDKFGGSALTYAANHIEAAKVLLGAKNININAEGVWQGDVVTVAQERGFLDYLFMRKSFMRYINVDPHVVNLVNLYKRSSESLKDAIDLFLVHDVKPPLLQIVSAIKPAEIVMSKQGYVHPATIIQKFLVGQFRCQDVIPSLALLAWNDPKLFMEYQNKVCRNYGFRSALLPHNLLQELWKPKLREQECKRQAAVSAASSAISLSLTADAQPKSLTNADSV